jgi:hypothetical protein
VINQYSFDGRTSAATKPHEGARPSASPLGVSGGHSDRPTITSTPMAGADVTRSVMTPIPPARIMEIIQAGWRSDLLRRLAVRSVNWIGATSALGRSTDPTSYYEVVLPMEKLQRSTGPSLRVEQRGSGDAAIVVVPTANTEQTRQWRARLGELLGLEPERLEYRLVFGHDAADHPRTPRPCECSASSR